MDKSLDRFLIAQVNDYEIALSEIKSGKKRSHWMWYMFPQISGLGISDTAKFYAITDINEAREYLNHPILGHRLREISTALLALEENNPNTIFGRPDDFKLKSSMTLFSTLDDTNELVFQKVLDKYFDGNPDSRTLDQIRV